MQTSHDQEMPVARHRGADPADYQSFTDQRNLALESAVEHLSHFLGMGYARESAGGLVGDHFKLTARQRAALGRMACSNDEYERRQVKKVDLKSGDIVMIDGINVLTTVERALGGGVVLACNDGTFRDIASHGNTFRRAFETAPALDLICGHLKDKDLRLVDVLIDRPLYNSGPIMSAWQNAAEKHGLEFVIRKEDGVDNILAASEHVIVTTDSEILDNCRAWTNLARDIIVQKLNEPWIVGKLR